MSVESSEKIKEWAKTAKKGEEIKLEPIKPSDGAVKEINKMVKKL